MPPWLLTVLFYVARRLLEPSTWLGIAGAVATFGLDPTPVHSAGEIVLAAGSALAMVLPEGLAARLGVKANRPPSPGA